MSARFRCKAAADSLIAASSPSWARIIIIIIIYVELLIWQYWYCNTNTAAILLEYWCKHCRYFSPC